MGEPSATEQLELVRAQLRPRRPARAATPVVLAATDPVATVCVDTGLAHLDRPFEYSVPEALAEAARPGVRVKVRFAGQDLDGFVLERRAEPEHEGRLTPLRRVVSPEPVLTTAVLVACREVAARYAGTLGDVLRLAVPPRHAGAERALGAAGERALGTAGEPALGTAGEPALGAGAGRATGAGDGPRPATPTPSDGAWRRYAAGPAYLQRVAAGEAPAASWLALPAPGAPGQDWPVALAEAAAAAVAGGRGALLVVPDHRDLDRVDAALTESLGKGRHVRLSAGQGPQARYTAFLKVLRGQVPVVVGTRAAAFAPVRDLGLVAWWDDGDDLHEEPRAPYPHVREVLAARARLEGAALLSGGFARTAAVEQWVAAGRVRSITGASREVRASVPRVVVAGDDSERGRDVAARAHLPSLAWRVAKQALESGPVLVQVPRRGYVPSLSCQNCRAPARCSRCQGPLALPSGRSGALCRWCGQGAAPFACRHCGGGVLRSTVVGARRTAEELGRAFPGVPVHTSGSGEVVVAGVPAAPSLVIATPGAEPVAEGGYAAALLLDAWALLDRSSLAAGEESLRRWLAAAALVRASPAGGSVVLCGAPSHTTIPAVEALVRWAPAWFAGRELADREALALPPAVRMAELTGPRHALEEALAGLRLPDRTDTLGPLTVDEERSRVVLRAPLSDGPRLCGALTELRAVRSARKDPVAVTIRVDPDID